MKISKKSKELLAREILILIAVILVPIGIYLAHQWVNFLKGRDYYLIEDILDVCYRVSIILISLVYGARGLIMAALWAIRVLKE